MPKRDEIHLRQSTNLYDLLDDGVENGSDLPVLVRLKTDPAQSSARAPHSAQGAPNDQSLSLGTTSRSWGGAFLGRALLAGGGAVAIWPVEMTVWHSRIRYLRSFAEHVSVTESRGYGIAVALAGVAILVFSLVRMHSPTGRT